MGKVPVLAYLTGLPSFTSTTFASLVMKKGEEPASEVSDSEPLSTSSVSSSDIDKTVLSETEVTVATSESCWYSYAVVGVVKCDC